GVPIHLVAGSDDHLVDQPFLWRLSEHHANLSLSIWPEAEHELPLTHPAACVTEIERLRASLLRRPDG
ncbi:MAG TPA: hypothetical protein VGV93_13975, partial [Acidimicrobiales bacterium]|nr:hypothetical protein [Acidimicrobiales bacterium]